MPEASRKRMFGFSWEGRPPSRPANQGQHLDIRVLPLCTAINRPGARMESSLSPIEDEAEFENQDDF